MTSRRMRPDGYPETPVLDQQDRASHRLVRGESTDTKASGAPWVDTSANGADPGPSRPALPVEDIDQAEGGANLYASTIRSAPLLSRQEEQTFGRHVRESRLRMTDYVAQVPAAVGVLVDLLTQVEAHERPVTDALFSPFDDFSGSSPDMVVGDSGSWRSMARSARRLYDEWRALSSAGSDPVRLDAMRARLAHLARSMQPGLPALRAALGVCVNLDNRVAQVETEVNAFHADILDGRGNPRTCRRLARVRREAGVDLTTLRESRREAESAYRRYSSARDRMVKANLRLAYFVAHKLKGNGLSFDDLIQEAMIGLMRAVDKFDYRKGYKFSTYAFQWIRQTATRAIAESSRTIRVAAHVHDDLVRLRRLGRELEQRLGREPSPEELARISGVPEAKIERYSCVTREPVSLDQPAAGIEDSTLSSIIADASTEDPDTQTHHARLAEAVEAILEALPEREAFIIRLRHGIGGSDVHTLQDIGGMLGITRERTRQLEARALNHLRESVSKTFMEGLDD